jgi:hypothetical protein
MYDVGNQGSDWRQAHNCHFLAISWWEKFIFLRFYDALYQTNTLRWRFIVLAFWKSIPLVDMLIYTDYRISLSLGVSILPLSIWFWNCSVWFLSKYMFTTKYSMFSWESETHNFYVLKFEPMIIFAYSEQAKHCTIDVALIKFNLYKCKQIKLY